MASKLVLSSGAVLWSSWPLEEMLDVFMGACRREASLSGAVHLLKVPLLVSEDAPERHAYVRPDAVEALEPVGVLVQTAPPVQVPETRPCIHCGRRFAPGQAYVPTHRGPEHVKC